MKRGAEKQITKDDGGYDDEIEEVSSEGFAKADALVLAGRPMKGLPKRGLSASPSKPSTSTFGGFEAVSTPKPPAFSFGASSNTASPTPFTFSSPLAPSTSPVQPSSTTPTSSPSASTTTSVFGPGSSATKAFSFIVANSSEPPNSSAPAPAMSAEDTVTETYYKCLRGLNISFLEAVKKAIKVDPFADCSEITRRYETHMSTILKQREASSKASTSFGSGIGQSIPSVSESKLPSFSMPVPPKSFFPSATGSGTTESKKTTDTSSSTPSFGFVPKLDNTSTSTSSPSSGFSFASPAASSSSPLTSTPFSFSSSTTSSSTTSGIFGKADGGAKPSDSASIPASSSTPISMFGNSKPSSVFGGTSLFGSAKPAESGITTTPSGGIFGNIAKPGESPSSFGSSGTFGSATKFGEGMKTSESAPTTLFGAAQKLPTSGFGSSTSSPFGFAGKGTFGNPVGFTFGGTTPDPESRPGSSQAASEKTDGEEVKLLSPAETPTPEDSHKLLGTSPHDEEGEGEQDEETKHSARLKVYKMKQSEGKPEWADMGIGYLRVKKHRTAETRRLLLRNSSNGKITINFNLYHGMHVTQAKNVISFVGHDQGEKATYRLKLKTEGDAADLKAAIEKEVAEIKA